MVFRGTNQHRGRRVCVTPANSTNRHLRYARIILANGEAPVQFRTEDRETGLILLNGAATVTVDGVSCDLQHFDGLYIPRGSSVQVSATSHADLAEFSAPVSGSYPLQVIRHADLESDPALKFTTGSPTQQRHLNIIFGKNVVAGRIMAGVTISEPGNWTSWPPHEHAEMLEEMYVYFDMPEPAFALQLVYNETQYPELVTVV